MKIDRYRPDIEQHHEVAHVQTQCRQKQSAVVRGMRRGRTWAPSPIPLPLLRRFLEECTKQSQSLAILRSQGTTAKKCSSGSLVSRGRCGREIARLRQLAGRGRCDFPAILRLTPKIASGQRFVCGRRQSDKPCDFCSEMVASPLAATVVTAILRCDFCAAKSGRDNMPECWKRVGEIGRNTVSRVLFRKRELTEFCSKSGEFCEKLGELALAHNYQTQRNSLSSLPGTW